jgi:hypothetical protein
MHELEDCSIVAAERTEENRREERERRQRRIRSYVFALLARSDRGIHVFPAGLDDDWNGRPLRSGYSLESCPGLQLQ